MQKEEYSKSERKNTAMHMHMNKERFACPPVSPVIRGIWGYFLFSRFINSFKNLKNQGLDLFEILPPSK
jgi:hypothetical protein